jgi:hypothetical protein
VGLKLSGMASMYSQVAVPACLDLINSNGELSDNDIRTGLKPRHHCGC